MAALPVTGDPDPTVGLGEDRNGIVSDSHRRLQLCARCLRPPKDILGQRRLRPEGATTTSGAF